MKPAINVQIRADFSSLELTRFSYMAEYRRRRRQRIIGYIVRYVIGVSLMAAGYIIAKL